MLLQELYPDVPCLPENTAKRIVEYGEKRLKKYGVDAFESTPPTILSTKDVQVSWLLGQGSFSAVYQVDDDQDHVIKVLKPKLLQKPALFAGCAADLVREGKLLCHLSHPNILQCHAMGTLAEFSNGRHDACVLLLERLDITLKDQLTEWRKQTILLNPHTKEKTTWMNEMLFVLSGGRNRRVRQTLVQRTDVLCQLAEAIHYLHSKGIMHRDLKPDNIGFADGVLKVFDLDVCRILPAEATKDALKLFQFTKRVGSPRYMAPEVARGEQYNAKADVYSFGLLAFELLSLKKAYEDIPSELLDVRVFYQGTRPHCPATWPRAVKSLITRCWAENVSDRPTMSKLLEELRETIDYMCPAAAKQRRRESQAWSKRSTIEDSGLTQRSESTLEVASQ